MIKVSVMYPNSPGAKFDHTYYRDMHMPLVKRCMGAGLHHYTVDKGLAGATPKDAPAYVAAGHLICESVEAFNASFGPHTREIMGDIKNYTDIQPIVMVSEIVVSKG